MKNLSKLCFVFLVVLFVSSCKKKEKIAGPNETAAITSFKIEAKNNLGFIESDLACTIVDRDIEIAMPEGINSSSLVASFTFTGSKITVGNSIQQSAVTANDFSKTLKYTVVATDGTSSTYNVVIKNLEDEALKFSTFSLLKTYNTALTEDIHFKIVNDTLMGTYTGYIKTFKPSFSTLSKNVSIATVTQTSNISAVDLSKTVTYKLTSNIGRQKNIVVKLNYKNIPHVYITTNGNTPIVSKDDYLNANIEIVGNYEYAGFKATTKIKGRGNSTWQYDKKPYKLKLDQKASIFGMGEDKEYVLLANYLDPMLMTNAVALKAGELLDMPYNNHIVPVDLTINGVYLGNYNLTEQITVNANRINIEDGGVLLELDSYFDEDYKFKSNNFNLPVNIKYPKLTNQNQVAPIKTDFQIMENLVNSSSFPNNNYADYIDLDKLVDYLLITNLVCNTEIGHPKSTYVYKPKNGKYTMGPLWDYDWAFDFSGTYFSSTTTSMFDNGGTGARFFRKFFLDPKFKAKYQQRWNYFKRAKLPDLLTFVDSYSKSISASYAQDYKLWDNGTGNLPNYTSQMKSWLQGRASYMDNYSASL